MKNELAVLEGTKITHDDVESIRTTRPSLAPSTFGEMMSFSQMLAKSTFVPKDFQGRPENILVAIQWGMEIGLPPMQALQNIAVINGRPSLWGDAALAIVQNHPAYEWHNERIEGSGDAMTGVFEIKRKGSDVHVARFSVADAKRAKLWDKQGPWSQYTARMLCLRARGFALRDKFADAMKGLITAEEARDYPTPPLTTVDSKGNESIVPPRDPDPVIEQTQVVAPFLYEGDRLRCTPVDAKLRTTKQGAQMAAIKFVGSVMGKNMAYCFHEHLFDAVLASNGKDSVFKVACKKGGWPTIDDVLSVDGDEYDTGKRIPAPSAEEIQKEELTKQLEASLEASESFTPTDDDIPF